MKGKIKMKKLLITTTAVLASVMLFSSNSYAGPARPTPQVIYEIDNTEANNYTNEKVAAEQAAREKDVALLRKAGDVASRVLNGTISPDDAASEMSKMVAAGDLAQADADYIQGQIAAFRRDYEAQGNKLQQLADLVNGAPGEQGLKDIVDSLNDSINGDGGLFDQVGELADRVDSLEDKVGTWNADKHNGNTMGKQINENEKGIAELNRKLDSGEIASGEMVDQAKEDAMNYADSQDAALWQAAQEYANEGDAATLAAANRHADEGDAATLTAANRYTDDAISGVDGRIASGDAATLSSAKDYADAQDAALWTAAQNYANEGDRATLKAANDYTDAAKVEAMNYADAQDQKVFAAANENAKGYAAQAQQNAMNYADTQDQKVLSTAQSYADAQDQKVFAAANENAKGYATQAQQNAQNYADAKDSELEQRVTAAYQKADAEMEARVTEAYTKADEAIKEGVFITEGVKKLEATVNGINKQMKSSFAAGAAMAALAPNARAEGNTHLSAGTGYYDGKLGAAVGVFHYIDDNVLLNAGLAYAGNDSFTAKGGVTVGF